MSEKPLPSKDPNLLNALGIVWEVIAIVAIPTVGFALGGRWLDRHFGTTPLFLAFGLLLTLVVIGILVTKRGKAIANKL
jgi:F0F1-type ATP synthase assembly protein I